MKILLLGASGQLGQSILRHAPRHWQIITPSSSELDIRQEQDVQHFIQTSLCDVIINAAAYTAVDMAESKTEDAFSLNALAPSYIAQAANTIGARFFHLSTDYVFDGKKILGLAPERSLEPSLLFKQKDAINTTLDNAADHAFLLKPTEISLQRRPQPPLHTDHAFLLKPTETSSREADKPFEASFLSEKKKALLHYAYTEQESPAPLSIYGKSKLQGEQLVQQHCPNSLIIRTSWAFSEYGNNFVKTMLTLGMRHQTLDVVADQWGCPSDMSEVAQAIIKLIQRPEIPSGLYHYSGQDVVSWFEFAQHIFHIAARYHAAFKAVRVNPVSTEFYREKNGAHKIIAPRPMYSALNSERLAQYGIQHRPYREGLERVIEAWVRER